MLLCLDWDETISSADTLALIAPPDGEQLHGPPFSQYSSAYASDLATHGRDRSPATTIEAQLDFLDSLDAVELASQKRIEEGGLFRDLSGEVIISRAATVELRPGWESHFAPWLRRHPQAAEAHVISVGWSAAFIRARLSASESSLPPNVPLSICANEVVVDPVTGLCTGRLTKSADATVSGRSGIRTGPDKLREMLRIVDSWRRERGGEGPICYIGDSNTDLPCLLEADIGMIMGSNAGLQDTCARLHIDVDPAKAWRPADSGLPRKLVRVSDWKEALELLQGTAITSEGGSG